MSEIKTDNPDKLAEWQRTNNLEVSNLAQLSAILMKHEELLKQVLAFASDNLKSMEEQLTNAHDRIDQMQQVIDEWLIKNNEPLMEIYDKAIWYLKRIEELESWKKSIFEKSL